MASAPGGLGAEEAARAFARLFESAPVGLALLDLEGRPFAVNAALLHQLGLGEAAVLGRPCTDFANPRDFEEVRSRFASLRRGAVESYTVERPMVGAGGREFQAQITMLLIRDEHGAPHCALALVEPMDELSLLRRERDLGKSIVHDLNNLLTVVLGSSEFLLHESAPRVRTNVERLREATLRSADLVRALIDPRITPEIELLDVRETLLDFLPVLDVLAGDAFEVEFNSISTPASVRVDRAGLERSIANLVGNACDAMPGGGTVTISVHTSAGSIGIAVADEGGGIDPAALPHIFENGYTTKSQSRGHGLGLANVRAFAEDAGGSIDVESTLGVGSTFTLRLPRAT
jgi:two-component system, cell cycle sensor histidine kinase and response regulator CckA